MTMYGLESYHQNIMALPMYGLESYHQKVKTTRLTYQCILNNMLKGFLKSGKSIVFKCNFFLFCQFFF